MAPVSTVAYVSRLTTIYRLPTTVLRSEWLILTEGQNCLACVVPLQLFRVLSLWPPVPPGGGDPAPKYRSLVKSCSAVMLPPAGSLVFDPTFPWVTR